MAKRHNSTSKNDLLLSSLMRYYESLDHRLELLDIIGGDKHGSIALRDMDYFVTTYASTQMTVANTSKQTGIKVNRDYHLNLKGVSKKRFDPCCRWERIYIPHGEPGNYIESTVGQLNFFRWIIETGLMEYIRAHHAEIKAHMASKKPTLRKSKITTANRSVRRKRQPEDVQPEPEDVQPQPDEAQPDDAQPEPPDDVQPEPPDNVQPQPDNVQPQPDDVPENIRPTNLPQQTEAKQKQTAIFKEPTLEFVMSSQVMCW